MEYKGVRVQTIRLGFMLGTGELIYFEKTPDEWNEIIHPITGMALPGDLPQLMQIHVSEMQESTKGEQGHATETHREPAGSPEEGDDDYDPENKITRTVNVREEGNKVSFDFTQPNDPGPEEGVVHSQDRFGNPSGSNR